jgi:hypothetical protein
MMARSTSVVMKVNALLDRSGNEAEHRLPVVPLCGGKIAYLVFDVKVDAESSAQPLYACHYAMPRENIVQPAVQHFRDAMDVIVESRSTICGHRSQCGSHRYRMAVIRAAVLARTLGHQSLHDLSPAPEHAQRISTANRFSNRA